MLVSLYVLVRMAIFRRMSVVVVIPVILQVARFAVIFLVMGVLILSIIVILVWARPKVMSDHYRLRLFELVRLEAEDPVVRFGLRHVLLLALVAFEAFVALVAPVKDKATLESEISYISNEKYEIYSRKADTKNFKRS